MIVLDVQAVQSAAHGERGIARYVGELARTLAREHPDLVDVFAWNDRLPYVARLDELDLGDRLRPFSELLDREVDVLHIGSPFEMLDLAVFAPPVRARRTIVTCYDLIPYRFPDRYLTDPGTAVRYRTRLALLAAADAVVTDSRSAADDVERLLGVAPGRVTVIGAGVSERFRPPDRTREELLASLRASVPDLEPGFVLVPAGIDWRKTVDGTRVASATPRGRAGSISPPGSASPIGW